ncbi:MAG TPA: Fe-S cluster assembly protein SufD [Steroidobacteraceae bacterium]|nr:Fe-S cluster assembly protein SufD [Steroidobacteraceae bacterium]
MSAPAPLERIAAAHAGLAPRLAGGASWDRRRRNALERLLARGLPERRDENWKYLDHARLGAFSFEPAAAAAVQVPPALVPLPLPSMRRVTLLDGRFEPALSDAPEDGVTVEDFAGLIARDPGAALGLLRTPGDDPDDRYALLADAFAANGVLIRVAAGASPAAPVCLTHLASAAAPGTHHSRLSIELGPGASLVLVERFVTAGAAAVLGNLAAELSLGRGATLVHVRLHEQGAAAAQVETWVARQDAGSRYEQYLFATGGAILRSNLRLALAGEAAACRLLGLFAAEGERQVDLHTLVTHEAPATRTEQECRGIARDRGRGAFNGRIVVQPAARGADASQSSRNLLLSPLAEINARPQLEIHVDDVRCRHGATVGSLDEAQLFYLRSRGLDPAAAAALLTWAFCADLIGRLPLPELRAAMQARFAAALPDRALLTGSA